MKGIELAISAAIIAASLAYSASADTETGDQLGERDAIELEPEPISPASSGIGPLSQPLDGGAPGLIVIFGSSEHAEISETKVHFWSQYFAHSEPFPSGRFEKLQISVPEAMTHFDLSLKVASDAGAAAIEANDIPKSSTLHVVGLTPHDFLASFTHSPSRTSVSQYLASGRAAPECSLRCASQPDWVISFGDCISCEVGSLRFRMCC